MARTLVDHLRTPLLVALLLALALVASAPVAVPWQSARATDSGPTHADQLGPALDALLKQQRKAMRVPGATATIVFADGSRWSGAAGKAMRNPEVKATPRTPFVVGSITKTFVAALILKLAEDGALTLDDPLSRWMPAYPNGANLSLRQLLSHSSGVYNYFEHPDYGRLVFKRPTYKWAPTEILETFERKPYFAPGAGYYYSNTNYVLLGLVAEAAGGAPLGEQLRTRFTQPLGLARTYFQGDGPPPVSSAKGHLLKPSGMKEISDSTGYRPTRSAATVAWAAGDGVATADDIATWARALYGGAVLAPDSLAEMLDDARYPGTGYGLGVRMRQLDGRRLVGHTGSLRGFVAATWHLPAEDTTIAVMTNRGRINANKIVNALLRRVFTDTIAPSVPTGLAGVAGDDRYVTLTWDASTDNLPGTITYRVLRNGTAIGTRQTSTSYIDRPAAGTHRYQVRAIDAAGNKSALSSSIYVTAVEQVISTVTRPALAY
jgi:D-alanyl-D-alanine carboxypeptidase